MDEDPAEVSTTARNSWRDEDDEFIEMERKDNLRRAANELLLIERAKEWLLKGKDE